MRVRLCKLKVAVRSNIVDCSGACGCTCSDALGAVYYMALPSDLQSLLALSDRYVGVPVRLSHDMWLAIFNQFFKIGEENR